ncbi:unnamed protein product [Lymnaea stagnalis]|uniref:Uncharacterized protein n=1 Tax=Lymnaea stagnalis TaxID=6523 RepID=A0AAV2HEA2_LYMST
MQKSVTIPDFLWILLMAFLCRDTNKLVSANESADCPLAEEGQPYSLKFTWALPRDKTYTSFIVENVHSLISTCIIGGNRCHDVFGGDLAKSVLKVSHTTGVASLTVALRNVSKTRPFNAEGKWTLKYEAFESPFISCNVNIVAKVRVVACKTGVNKYAICVTCSVQNLVHRSKCLFASKSKELDLMKIQSTILYDNETHQHSGLLPLITSKCTLRIPVRQLRPGNLHLVVNIDPEITGDDKGLKLGTEKSIFINFNGPSIADCHPVIDVGTDSICTCERSDNTLQTTLASLHHNNNNDNSPSIEYSNGNYSSSNATIYSEVAVTSTSDQNIPIILLFVVGGNILLISIVVTVLWYKKKTSNVFIQSCFPCNQEKTKQRNDYDPINGGYLLVDHSVTGDSHQYGTTRVLPSNIVISAADGTTLDENHYETIDEVRDIGDIKYGNCRVGGNTDNINDANVDKDVSGRIDIYSTIIE